MPVEKLAMLRAGTLPIDSEICNELLIAVLIAVPDPHPHNVDIV